MDLTGLFQQLLWIVGSGSAKDELEFRWKRAAVALLVGTALLAMLVMTVVLIGND